MQHHDIIDKTLWGDWKPGRLDITLQHRVHCLSSGICKIDIALFELRFNIPVKNFSAMLGWSLLPGLFVCLN